MFIFHGYVLDDLMYYGLYIESINWTPFIPVGRISDQNPEQYSHAIFMRFQTKDDLTKFYQNPFYVGVLKEHVMPYCHVCSDM